MEEEVKEQLISLNQEFYREFARPFAETRGRPQPGFERLLPFLPPHSARVLDVGCGEGRFGRFLFAHVSPAAYTGVDFTEQLMTFAGADLAGNFEVKDLGQPGCLEGLGYFDVVACLATMQHIPGQQSRIRLLTEMGRRLAAEGRILMSNWQFLSNERQRRKVMDWSQVGLSREDVEPNDYLLSWQRDGFGLRYVAHIDEVETEQMAESAGLEIIENFRSDGREGDLNLYTVLANQRMG